MLITPELKPALPPVRARTTFPWFSVLALYGRLEIEDSGDLDEPYAPRTSYQADAARERQAGQREAEDEDRVKSGSLRYLLDRFIFADRLSREAELSGEPFTDRHTRYLVHDLDYRGDSPHCSRNGHEFLRG
jgi:hypothetical protein